MCKVGEHFMNQEFYNQLVKGIEKERVLLDEPMNKHITFRVGGPADYFVMPKTMGEVKYVVGLCKEMGMPYYVIGNGSNLLVSDNGFRGVIIQIYKEMNEICVDGEIIDVQAGALLSKIGSKVVEMELAGFEFAAGIPGTVGGAVVMNAGAYGGEMKDILVSATVLTDEGEICEIANSELELGYRTSLIQKKDWIVLGAKFKLSKGNVADIRAKMEELKIQRVTKQPLEYPSAGSTFKRPEGYFAGKLIQDAGLRGFQVGGAQVSEKHCGFVINKENASAQDIANLMCEVAEKVYQQFGVRLEAEVKRLGEF